MRLEVYDSAENALRGMTERLVHLLRRHDGLFHLALSGAGTARRMYDLWVREYREAIPWERLWFYWVDERCVEPQDEESNFKYADELLFRPLGIPVSHVHRIGGERVPETEAERYAELVARSVAGRSRMPCFDCVILGVGEDGHTASIFPDALELLTDKRSYAVARHPLSGQKRITMTGTLILNSKTILIPVIGRGKTDILQKIVNASGDKKTAYPAAYIISHAPEAVIFTDSPIGVR